MISSIAFSCSFFPLVHIRQIQYPCHTATTLSTIPTRPSTRLTMRSILSSGREEMCADRGPIENSNIFKFAVNAGSQSGERHWLKRRKVGFARATDLDANTTDTYSNRLLGSCSSSMSIVKEMSHGTAAPTSRTLSKTINSILQRPLSLGAKPEINQKANRDQLAYYIHRFAVMTAS